MAVSNVEIRVNANNAVAQLNRLNGVAGTTAGTFGRLKSAAAGLGLGLIAKSAIQSAASFNDLQTRLKLVTSEFGEFEQAQALVAKAAKTFGLSNREAAEGVADIFTRLRPLGIELADIESSFIGFNTVARLSGVSAAGASAAFTQLAQALGSGRLQGDEFRSIAEQIPGLLGAVSLETGVAIGDLKEFASDGKLTTDILIRALKRVEKEGAGKIAAIIKDSDVQRLKDFQNASDELSVAIGSKLLPAVEPLIVGATELIKVFGELPEPIQTGTIAVIGLAGAAAILGPAISTVSGAITVLAGGTVLKSAITGLAVMGEKALAAAAGKTVLAKAVTAANVKITAMTVSVGLLNLALKALPFVIVAGAVATFVGQMLEAKKIQEDVNKLVKTGTKIELEAALATHERTLAEIEYQNTVRALLPGALGGAARGGAAALEKISQRTETVRNAIEKIREQLGKLKAEGSADPKPPPPTPQPQPVDEDEAERLRRIAEGSADRVRSLEQQTLLASALTAEERRQFQRQIQIADIVENTVGLSEDQLKTELAATLALFEAEDATRAINDANKERLSAAQKLKEEQEAQQKQAERLAGTIKNKITDAIMGAIDGSKSLKDSLVDVLKMMASSFLNQGIGGIGKAFKIPGFANGGRPPVGRPSIVGERGPELFVPSRAGTIVPNDQLGSSTSVVVNVDASGTEVQGNQGNADQLGRLIGQAVQAELIKQKRPGGLLTR